MDSYTESPWSPNSACYILTPFDASGLQGKRYTGKEPVIGCGSDVGFKARNAEPQRGGMSSKRAIALASAPSNRKLHLKGWAKKTTEYTRVGKIIIDFDAASRARRKSETPYSFHTLSKIVFHTRTGTTAPGLYRFVCFLMVHVVTSGVR